MVQLDCTDSHEDHFRPRVQWRQLQPHTLMYPRLLLFAAAPSQPELCAKAEKAVAQMAEVQLEVGTDTATVSTELDLLCRLAQSLQRQR